MLSILIPTYRYNALPLVASLHQQAIAANITFEVICFDDGATEEFNIENKKINALSNAHFESLKTNVGLSQNRNLLAQKSQYDYLLFIDGDSEIPDVDFIANYVNQLPKKGIIYGGRIHPKTRPEKHQQLRWKYGLLKEDKVADLRSKTPYRCLLFNNALIEKTSFERIGFSKEIRTYGHEDTLFAYHAQKNAIPITHINNPVSHKDIDSNKMYLQKTQMGLQNLKRLYEQQKIEAHFVTLLKYFEFLKKSNLLALFTRFFRFFEVMMLQNLKSSKPSLFIFDVYKLGYFCGLNTKK